MPENPDPRPEPCPDPDVTELPTDELIRKLFPEEVVEWAKQVARGGKTLDEPTPESS